MSHGEPRHHSRLAFAEPTMCGPAGEIPPDPDFALGVSLKLEELWMRQRGSGTCPNRRGDGRFRVAAARPRARGLARRDDPRPAANVRKLGIMPGAPSRRWPSAGRGRVAGEPLSTTHLWRLASKRPAARAADWRRRLAQVDPPFSGIATNDFEQSRCRRVTLRK